MVVANAATDHTAPAVAAPFPHVEVLSLDRKLGAHARNLGARYANSPLLAFSDDGSWWVPGSLARAAALFDRHPRLALAAARVLVGPDDRLDPVCEVMAASPLGTPADLPGPAVLGFIACGAVVRRDAFLEAGGFHDRYLEGCEEALLALDLACRGWGLAYVDDLITHHHRLSQRDNAARCRRDTRNDLWTAWLRRPTVPRLNAASSFSRPIAPTRRPGSARSTPSPAPPGRTAASSTTRVHRLRDDQDFVCQHPTAACCDLRVHASYGDGRFLPICR